MSYKVLTDSRAASGCASADVNVYGYQCCYTFRILVFGLIGRVPVVCFLESAGIDFAFFEKRCAVRWMRTFNVRKVGS